MTPVCGPDALPASPGLCHASTARGWTLPEQPCPGSFSRARSCEDWLSDLPCSVQLPGDLSWEVQATQAVQGPDVVLSLRLRAPGVRYAGAIHAERIGPGAPWREALAVDLRNAMRLWAADVLRVLASKWDRAGGGA